MKRTAFLFLVLFLIFPLSCKEKSDLLTYQQGNFHYNAKLTVKDLNAEYLISVTKENDSSMKLEFLFPEELLPISFKKDDSGVCAFCNGEPWDGMTFPYAEEIFALFGIDSGSFISAESSKEGEIPFCRATFENGITVILDSRDNSPLVIENESIKLTVIK